MPNFSQKIFRNLHKLPLGREYDVQQNITHSEIPLLDDNILLTGTLLNLGYVLLCTPYLFGKKLFSMQAEGEARVEKWGAPELGAPCPLEIQGKKGHI